MNMKKTKIMWFGVNNKNENVTSTIYVSGSIFERVYSYQYFGIELDSLLCFDKHYYLDNVVAKCTQKLYI